MTEQISIVSLQGPRTHMEDRSYADLHFGGGEWIFSGVYDGHRGAHAAQYAADHLHQRKGKDNLTIMVLSLIPLVSSKSL